MDHSGPFPKFAEKSGAFIEAHQEGILGAYLFLYCAFLVLRCAGSAALIMGDEYQMNVNVRHLPLTGVTENDALHFFIYKLANLWGSDFYQGVRFLNALFYSAALFPIFKTARLLLPPLPALFAVFLASLDPFNFYAAVFMREPLEFLAFAVLALNVLTLNEPAQKGRALICGFLLGLCMLVKTSMFFLAPAVFCHFFLLFHFRKRAGGKAGFWLSLCGGLLAGKYGLGWLLCGKRIFSLFGPRYDAHLPAHPDLAAIIRIAWDMLFNFCGEICGALYLYAIPVCLALFAAREIRRGGADGAPTPLGKISLLALCSLFFGCAFAAMFSGLAASSPMKIPQASFELHSRYFMFIFPLFLIVALFFSLRRVRTPRTLNPVFGFCVLIILYLVIAKFRPYSVIFIKTPALWIFASGSPRVYLALNSVLLLACAIFFFRKRLGARIYCLAFLPLYFCFANLHIQGIFLHQKAPHPYERAAAVVSALAGDAADDLLIVAPSHGERLFYLFYADKAQLPYKIEKNVSDGMINDLLKRHDKIIVLSDAKFGDNPFKAKEERGFTLFIRRPNS